MDEFFRQETPRAQKEHRCKLTEINKTIGESVKENGGYCPCMLVKTPDTKCPCKEFREAKSGTVCHCGRYRKE